MEFRDLFGFAVLVLALQVGCDGVVGSTARVDQCGVCNGDNKSCRVVQGIFTRRHLKYGYNTITNIPAGACNINITEMARSRNYLAVKLSNGSGVINGNWQLVRAGDYNAAGTRFKYDRFSSRQCPGECIFAKGPTTEPVEIQLLYYRRNVGIRYMFTVPVDSLDSAMKTYIPGTDLSSSAHTHRRTHSGNHRSRARTHGNSVDQSNFRTGIQTDTNSSDVNGRKIRVGQSPRYISPYDTSYQQFRTGNDNGNRYGTQETANRYGTQEIGTRYGTQEAINRYRASSYRNSYQNSRTSSYRNTVTNQNSVPVSRPGYRYRNVPVRGSSTYSRSSYSNDNVYNGRTYDGNGYQTNSIDTPSNSRPRISNTVDPINFHWRISGFTDCSATCGGGSQDTKVVCMKRQTNIIVTSENCDPAVKPEVQAVTCNNVPCPEAGWESEDWSECSATCGQGMQTRRVECKQRISSSISIPVSAKSCDLGARPVSSRSCKTRPCAQWEVGEWTKCTVNCGHGQKSRTVRCLNSQNVSVSDGECEGIKPETQQSCDMGACAQGWFHTAWSEECSTKCGKGYHTRKVYCSAEDSTPLPEEKCGDKPHTKKKCQKTRPCGGHWFTGPWTGCTVTCGSGTRQRDVVCMKKLDDELFAIVDEENCLPEDKPQNVETCPELSPCSSEWFMTEWSECSASCGIGTKTRDLKCLDPALHPSSTCDSDDKPAARHTCNTHSCDKPEVLQDPGCVDKWIHCKLVVQARLCSYYRDKCCESCTNHHNHHKHHKRRHS